jgi:hypothetical protein
LVLLSRRDAVFVRAHSSDVVNVRVKKPAEQIVEISGAGVIQRWPQPGFVTVLNQEESY